MALSRLYPAGYVFLRGDGLAPASSGQLSIFDNGTANLATIYTTIAGDTAATNPITLGDDGRLPNDIFVSEELYRVQLLDVLSAQVFQKDNIPSMSFDRGLSNATTITALKALSPDDGDSVVVADYAATGDGGGGVFVYDSTDSASDNGGTVIQPNAGGGRWRLKHQGVASIFNFGGRADGATDITAAVQSAVDSGVKTILFPPGDYKHRSTVNITTDGITLLGYGAKILAGADLSAGLAGPFVIDASDFAAYGFEFEADSRVSAFRITPSANRENFTFADMVTNGMFYAVNGGDTSTFTLTDVRINNFRSIGPSTAGDFAGHFLFNDTNHVQITNCHTRYGENASCYGFADRCSHITVTGCTARDNQNTQPSDASLQIENSPNANAVIEGNEFDHDIWVDDSSNVTIGPNKARRIRLTVQNADVDNIVVTGGQYQALNFDDFSTPDPGVTINNAKLQGMQLDPVSGSYESGIFMTGAVIEKVTMKDIEFISNGSTANLSLVRNALNDLRFDNIDFNGGAFSVSGSGGTINAEGCTGLVSRNQGTTAITSGNTSVTVPHGLSSGTLGAPIAGEILITPTNDPTNAVANYWVDNITITSFDLNVDTDPGASGFTFGWTASRERV